MYLIHNKFSASIKWIHCFDYGTQFTVALSVCKVAERDLGAVPPADGWEDAIARRRWVPAYRDDLLSVE